MTQWVVSAYAVFSWRDGHLEITTSSGQRLASQEPDLPPLLQFFAHPRTVTEFVQTLEPSVRSHMAVRIADLIRCGVLVPADEQESASVHHWEPSALAYYHASRTPQQRNIQAARAPAVAPSCSATSIPLPRGCAKRGRDLLDILESRRTVRRWRGGPISLETFSHVLWSCARNRECHDSERREYVSRVYPSGGAAYSLEIYPVTAAAAVEELSTGVYRYQPECHALEPISTKAADAERFLGAAQRAADAESGPPVALLVTSRYARQSERYGAMAYDLVLKEVGCLFQTLYLVAGYFGLGACAVTASAPPGALARLLRKSEVAEPLLGEFLLGPVCQQALENGLPARATDGSA